MWLHGKRKTKVNCILLLEEKHMKTHVRQQTNLKWRWIRERWERGHRRWRPWKAPLRIHSIRRKVGRRVTWRRRSIVRSKVRSEASARRRRRSTRGTGKWSTWLRQVRTRSKRRHSCRTGKRERRGWGRSRQERVSWRKGLHVQRTSRERGGAGSRERSHWWRHRGRSWRYLSDEILTTSAVPKTRSQHRQRRLKEGTKQQQSRNKTKREETCEETRIASLLVHGSKTTTYSSGFKRNQGSESIIIIVLFFWGLWRVIRNQWSKRIHSFQNVLCTLILFCNFCAITTSQCLISGAIGKQLKTCKEEETKKQERTPAVFASCFSWTQSLRSGVFQFIRATKPSWVLISCATFWAGGSRNMRKVSNLSSAAQLSFFLGKDELEASWERGKSEGEEGLAFNTRILSSFFIFSSWDSWMGALPSFRRLDLSSREEVEGVEEGRAEERLCIRKLGIKSKKTTKGSDRQREKITKRRSGSCCLRTLSKSLMKWLFSLNQTFNH